MFLGNMRIYSPKKAGKCLHQVKPHGFCILMFGLACLLNQKIYYLHDPKNSSFAILFS